MMTDGIVWGMGGWHVLGVALLALVLAALIKYVFYR
jgi:hypothetical protein